MRKREKGKDRNPPVTKERERREIDRQRERERGLERENNVATPFDWAVPA